MNTPKIIEDADGLDENGFCACPECGVNRVDPEFVGPDSRSVCDECRELD